MHLAYLDDSDTKSKSRKWQVMSGVIMQDRAFTLLEYAMGSIRDDLVPPERLDRFEEFHACELYGGYGVFEGLEQERRFEAINKLLGCLKFGELSVVYGGVDITALQHEVYASADPLDISFRICLKGLRSWIDERIVGHNITSLPESLKKGAEVAANAITQEVVTAWLEELVILIVDECDKQVKTVLHKSFHNLRPRHKLGQLSDTRKLLHFHDDMYFGDSRYSIGIQLADMCSYFIGRHLEGDSEIEEFYNMIKPHIVFSETHPEQTALEIRAATNEE